MAAIAAATSWNSIPMAEATGIALPIAGVNLVASTLPSLTAAVRMSTAAAPDRFSEPYALTAEVAASATTEVSPRPIAAPLAEASMTSIAVAPRKPADDTKNMASASSWGPRPVTSETSFTLSVNWATAPEEIPTNASILTIDFSKDTNVLRAKPPIASRGRPMFLKSNRPVV